MLQYSGVAKRALRLVREKTNALIQDLKEGTHDQLWTETMSCACDLTNTSLTTSSQDRISPYKKWYGTTPALNQLQPFRTIGYMRMPTRKHKLTPRRENASCWASPTTTQVVPLKCVTSTPARLCTAGTCRGTQKAQNSKGTATSAWDLDRGGLLASGKYISSVG